MPPPHRPRRPHGRHDTAKTQLAEARRLFEDLDAAWEVAWSDRYLGDAFGVLGDSRHAVELQLTSISAFRELGDAWSTAYGLYNVAGLMLHLPEYGPVAARPYLMRCLRICRDIGDSVWEAHALRTLAEAAYLTGDPEALGMLRQAIDRFRLLGDDTCLSTSLGLVGDLEANDGRWGEAADASSAALRDPAPAEE